MKIKILLICLLAIVLITSCDGASARKYEIVFNDGTSIIIDAEQCVPKELSIQCYPPGIFQFPDQTYFNVSSMREIK